LYEVVCIRAQIDRTCFFTVFCLYFSDYSIWTLDYPYTGRSCIQNELYFLANDDVDYIWVIRETSSTGSIANW